MKTRIRALMKERKITAVALGEKIGVTRVTIGNILSGRTMGTVETLSRIADALEVPFWQLFVSPEEVGADMPNIYVNVIVCPHCGKAIEFDIKPKQYR